MQSQMAVPDLLSLMLAFVPALVSAWVMLRLGMKRRDWLYLLIGACLAWIAAVYALVLTGVMKHEFYPAWVRPAAAFVFVSFAILAKGKRL